MFSHLDNVLPQMSAAGVLHWTPVRAHIRTGYPGEMMQDLDEMLADPDLHVVALSPALPADRGFVTVTVLYQLRVNREEDDSPLD
jgi:hypothetical protein